MKALQYLLMVMVVAIVSVTAQAQPTAQFKNSQNEPVFSRSAKTGYAFYTSTLMESGSKLPIAARNGLTIGANTPDDNTPSGGVGGPRRAKQDDDPFGGETIEGTGNPQEPGTPVGDGLWAMAILAAGYAAIVAYRRRKGVDADAVVNG